MGHKPDDYEEEQNIDGMIMGGWQAKIAQC